MNEAELAKTDDYIAHLKARAGVHESNKTTFDALNTVRDWVDSAAANAVVRLGAGYKPSIEKRLTNMERADTWIRCGVDAFLEGKTINTFFLIKAIGDEIVIEELRHQGKGEVKARVPIAKPDYVPELHDIIVDTIILNVSNELSET